MITTTTAMGGGVSIERLMVLQSNLVTIWSATQLIPEADSQLLEKLLESTECLRPYPTGAGDGKGIVREGERLVGERLVIRSVLEYWSPSPSSVEGRGEGEDGGGIWRFIARLGGVRGLRGALLGFLGEPRAVLAYLRKLYPTLTVTPQLEKPILPMARKFLPTACLILGEVGLRWSSQGSTPVVSMGETDQEWEDGEEQLGVILTTLHSFLTSLLTPSSDGTPPPPPFLNFLPFFKVLLNLFNSLVTHSTMSTVIGEGQTSRGIQNLSVTKEVVRMMVRRYQSEMEEEEEIVKGIIEGVEKEVTVELTWLEKWGKKDTIDDKVQIPMVRRPHSIIPDHLTEVLYRESDQFSKEESSIVLKWLEEEGGNEFDRDRIKRRDFVLSKRWDWDPHLTPNELERQLVTLTNHVTHPPENPPNLKILHSLISLSAAHPWRTLYYLLIMAVERPHLGETFIHFIHRLSLDRSHLEYIRPTGLEGAEQFPPWQPSCPILWDTYRCALITTCHPHPLPDYARHWTRVTSALLPLSPHFTLDLIAFALHPILTPLIVTTPTPTPSSFSPLPTVTLLTLLPHLPTQFSSSPPSLLTLVSSKLFSTISHLLTLLTTTTTTPSSPLTPPLLTPALLTLLNLLTHSLRTLPTPYHPRLHQPPFAPLMTRLHQSLPHHLIDEPIIQNLFQLYQSTSYSQ